MKKDIHNFTLDYFIKHQKQLVKKYKGKELLMDFSGVVAAFDTLKEAIATGDKVIGYGKYSVMKCLPGKEAYTATICPLFLSSSPLSDAKLRISRNPSATLRNIEL